MRGNTVSTSDPDNFKSMTLLTTYDELFDKAIWKRIEEWLMSVETISSLRDAGRKGSSCICAAPISQETLVTNFENHQIVYVTYLYLSEAFDSI